MGGGRGRKRDDGRRRERPSSTANQWSTRSRPPNLMRSRPARARTATSLFTAAAGDLRAAKRRVEAHSAVTGRVEWHGVGVADGLVERSRSAGRGGEGQIDPQRGEG